MKPIKYNNIYIVLILLLVPLSFVKSQFIAKENFVKQILESPIEYALIPGQIDHTETDLMYNFNNLSSGGNNSTIAYDPGSISTPATIVCDGSTITINNTGAATGIALGSYHYTFQVSNDNGITWSDASEESTTTNPYQLPVYEGSLKLEERLGLLAY